jgi:hypothetical protein
LLLAHLDVLAKHLDIGARLDDRTETATFYQRLEGESRSWAALDAGARWLHERAHPLS